LEDRKRKKEGKGNKYIKGGKERKEEMETETKKGRMGERRNGRKGELEKARLDKGRK